MTDDVRVIRIVSWNLNHRVGMTRFRPEAVDAAIALKADVLCFNEYFAQNNAKHFESRLAEGGWVHQIVSPPTSERANRVLIAARMPIQRDRLKLPKFDQQFPANILSVRLPEPGLRLLALRVPWYATAALRTQSWDWIESAAVALGVDAAIIIGDLNVPLEPRIKKAANPLRRLQDRGWTLATPAKTSSYFSHRGARSTLDHLFHTASVAVTRASFVECAGGHVLAGTPEALSDHAALVADVRTRPASRTESSTARKLA